MFNIGDVVEVIEDSPYSITTAGSQGTIVAINPVSVGVHFHFLTSGRYGENDYGFEKDTYRIDVVYLKSTKRISKEEIVCNKIRSIYARQGRKTKLSCFS